VKKLTVETFTFREIPLMSTTIQHLADLSESFTIDDESTRSSLMQFHARLLASPWQRTAATTSPSLRSLLQVRKKKKKKKSIGWI
jgi:hypothetical protein